MSEPDIQIQRDYPQTLVNSQWVKWAAERIAELEAENKALRKLLESHCQTLEARYDASDDAADYEVWQSWLGKISQKNS